MQCDYQRPQCGKCISSNLQCQGYGGRFIFVSCNDDNDGTAVPSPRQAEDTPETRLAAPAPDPSKLLKDNRFRFFDCFLAEYTPQRSALREHSLEWMVQLTDRPGSSSPLENAANALGTMVVARGSHRSDMLTAGMRLYGSSMSELAVERLTRVNWLNTLMTALLLQIYEVGNGWHILFSFNPTDTGSLLTMPRLLRVPGPLVTDGCGMPSASAVSLIAWAPPPCRKVSLTKSFYVVVSLWYVAYTS